LGLSPVYQRWLYCLPKPNQRLSAGSATASSSGYCSEQHSERSALSITKQATRGARLTTLAADRLKVVPCGNLRFAFFPLLSVKPHLKWWHRECSPIRKAACYDIERFTECCSILTKAKCWADGSRSS
jgi:hypothetical protein